ncbi:alpha-amylase [Sanguibacter sp. A247]|uniref:alpha-amylase n=1 Tax=unclassified Sanguibacter TaxID=2645534 RepID=UPI003FD89AE9
MRTARTTFRLAGVAAVAAMLAACSGGTAAPDGTASLTDAAAPDTSVATSAGPDAGPLPGVGIQMFQWTWDSIARECTDVLGPRGISWVLTSPPQEHIVGAQWWTSYQPVSHEIESRLGTREQFADMVATCDDAGVGIVADAVLNHMAGQNDPGTGWAGSDYEHYEYPGLFSDAEGDFHHCDALDGDIQNYKNADEVQGCELVNLADLATETERVRTALAAYLADLVDLGVAGVRVDAAKHMPPADIAAILADLPADAVVWQEVIRGGGEPVTPEQYVDNGAVFEFGYGRELVGLLGGSTFRQALTLGERGMLESESAVVFVTNHDTERNGETLMAQDDEYLLANVLMLAGAYGTPVLYSGYTFEDRDAGPAQDPDGRVLDASCTEGVGPGSELEVGAWTCEQRWPGVQGMLQWRSVTDGAGLTAVDDSASDVLAFSRGKLGMIIVNRDDEAVVGTWTTTLAPGTYCDVSAGPVSTKGCGGATIEVAAGGTVTATVPARGFVAVHAEGHAG